MRPRRPGAGAAQSYGSRLAGGSEPTNLGDILEHVLDKVRLSIADVDLVTISLQALISSIGAVTARHDDPAGPGR